MSIPTPPTTLDQWLQAQPAANVPHEMNDEGRVVLVRPKFMGKSFRWMQRLLSRPNFRVKLDAQGTQLWLHLDGQRTVAELAELQRLAFGADAEPAEDRAVSFVRQLVSGGFAKLS